MGTLSVIIAIILTIVAAAFLVWFWIRTPENLSGWYCIPVILIVTLLVIFIWIQAVLPMFYQA